MSTSPDDSPTRNSAETARASSSWTRTTTALLVLAVFFTLYVAAGFFMPLVLAILLTLIFRPLVMALKRIHVPTALSAALIIITLFGLAGYGVHALSAPVRQWVAEAPTTLARMEDKLRTLRRPIEQAGKAAEQVQQLANPQNGKVPAVAVQPEGFGARMLSGTLDAATSIVIVAFLMFFLLATGGRLLTKVSDYIAHRSARASSADLVTEIEKQVSRCLALSTMINIGLGVAVGCGLWALGLPHPVVWGVVVTLLNYIPYLGGVIGTALVAVAGFLAFDEPLRMIGPPACYIVLNTIEGMLVTPLVLGRRFSLDSCFVFIWLMYWSWTWGAVGAVIAMPLLSAVKITCDRVPALAELGRLISAEEPETPRDIVSRLRRRRAARARSRIPAAATGR